MTTVYSYPYDVATGTAGPGKTIIQNMHIGGHSTRTLWVSKFNTDLLLVSHGSFGNMDPPTANITSGRSQIRAFSISGISTAAVNYTEGEVIGWGLRNSVGMTEDLTTGDLVSTFPSSSNV